MSENDILRTGALAQAKRVLPAWCCDILDRPRVVISVRKEGDKINLTAGASTSLPVTAGEVFYSGPQMERAIRYDGDGYYREFVPSGGLSKVRRAFVQGRLEDDPIAALTAQPTLVRQASYYGTPIGTCYGIFRVPGTGMPRTISLLVYALIVTLGKVVTHVWLHTLLERQVRCIEFYQNWEPYLEATPEASAGAYLRMNEKATTKLEQDLAWLRARAKAVSAQARWPVAV